MIRFIFYGTLILLFSTSLFPATKYVKSLRAKIMDTPSHGGKLLVPARQGDAVDEVKIENKWSFVKVPSAKKEGWIPSLLLSPTPPMQMGALFKKDVDLSKSARKRASTFTSTAAARGLTSKSDDVFKNLGTGNYEALKEMESKLVDPKTGLQFLHAGLKKKEGGK